MRAARGDSGVSHAKDKARDGCSRLLPSLQAKNKPLALAVLPLLGLGGWRWAGGECRLRGGTVGRWQGTRVGLEVTFALFGRRGR